MGTVLTATTPFALSLSFDKLRMIGGFDKLSPSGAWENVLQRTNPFALSLSKRRAKARTELGGART